MSDVQETLQELMIRRLREMGAKRGHEKPLPLKQAHERLPVGRDGKPIVSYETFRQLLTGVHSGRITDPTADALAYALDADVDDILLAAGQRPRVGPFALPARAQQLDRRERRVVLGVINAILDARGVATEEAEEEDVVSDLPNLGEARDLRRQRLIDQGQQQRRAGYDQDDKPEG